ncbi:MAG: HAMP domain-containing histidine kinase [Candidatus Obscuribacterales bacterium]|nr:HAMP domain-containing histidine kinase [Candidatus Obscuribacterales bacterium]
MGITLVCQVVFPLILLRNIGLLEEAGRKETNAKAVISCLLETKSVMSRMIIDLVGRRIVTVTEGSSVKNSFSEVAKEKFATIDSLVADDPVARKIAKRYREDFLYLCTVASDFGIVPSEGVTNKVMPARFLNDTEQMEEVLICSRRCIQEDATLRKHYVPILQEWSPKALAERESLRRNLLIVIAAEIAISVGIAVVIGRRLVTRLKTLMSNIDKFSCGDPDFERLAGNDELTELDERFRQMTIAKHNAEEFKRSLMGMVAHDLRSPLTSSTLIIDNVLNRNTGMDEWTSTRLKRLQSELARLVRLANTLLDIERAESNKLELHYSQTSLRRLAQLTFAALEGAAEVKNIELVQSIESDQDVYVDEDRIVQVLVNLVSNAVKFSPANEEITIRVQKLENDDAFVLFEVIDRGPGVPPAEQTYLFQKFVQTGSDESLKKQGTGFGLYLSDLIIKGHGGKIGYKHSKEGGSNFFFTVPSSSNESR